ncbi:MAG: aminotransferase class I/II-fold pyridoxal phosphate-dependent enzyme [Myxococcota bacterium]
MIEPRHAVSTRARQMPMPPIRAIFEAASRMDDVVRLEVGEPDFGPPAWLREAHIDALRRDSSHYTSFSGLMALREAIAEKLERENAVRRDPTTEVLVTAGATGALYQALQATVDPGDEVLLPSPGWPQYIASTQLAGGVPIFYPLHASEGFTPRVEDIARLITPRTRVLLLNSPGNPTGGVIDRARLEALAALACEHDLLVLSDEVYEHIRFDGHSHTSPASLPGMAERTITIHSASKTFAVTGWRIGFAAGPAAHIAPMTKIGLSTCTHPSTPAQMACVTAYRRSAEGDIAGMVATLRQRRDFLCDSLAAMPGIRCARPAGAFYVFANVEGTGLGSEAFSWHLLRAAGVATVPGVGFGPGGEGYVRLSFAASMGELERGVERIHRALTSLSVD